MRKVLLLVTVVIVLLLCNYTIWQRENLISNGRTVLLELAPVDPRSLMQGDYMALRYDLERKVELQQPIKESKDGQIVLGVDGRGVGTFRSFASKIKPSDGEVVVKYRIRKGQLKIATNAFFFQEGHGEHYQNARYGEFRLSPNGDAILVALRDGNLRVLGLKNQT